MCRSYIQQSFTAVCTHIEMTAIFDINEALAALGLKPSALHDSVLESTFRNPEYAPLGYFPNESMAQLRARYFTPFKAVLKQPRVETFVDHASGETRTVKRGVSIVYERDFEGMNAAAASMFEIEKRAEEERIEKLRAEQRTKDLESKVAAQKAQLESLSRALTLATAAHRVKEQVQKTKQAPKREEQRAQDHQHVQKLLAERAPKPKPPTIDQRRALALLAAKASAERLEREEAARKEAAQEAVREEARVKAEEIRLAKEKAEQEARVQNEKAARVAAKASAKALQEAARAEFLKRQKEEADLLDAALSENAERTKKLEFTNKADRDLAALKTPLIVLQLDTVSVPQIPHHLAVFTMVFCIGMREKLMLNILHRFSAWSKAARLPGFAVLRPLFKEQLILNEREAVMPPPLYNTSGIQTRGIQLVIQCMRNIMGVVLDLRCLIQPTAVDSIINTSSLYHSRFLKIANICKIRQLSLIILDAMDLLATRQDPRPSPELMELYHAVALFEQFVQGSDFTVFRQAFVLPSLPPLSETMFPSKILRTRVEDTVMAQGLRVEEFMLWELDSKKPSFVKYKNDCKPLFDITLALWKSQVLKPVSRWLKNVDLPTVEEFTSNKQFVDLLPMWFGITDKSKWKIEPFIDLDVFVEKMKSNAKAMDADISHQMINLAFLLSDAVHDFASTFSPMSKLNFPFSVTLKEKWEALCTIHSDKNDMLILNAHLLDLAEKLNLE